MVVRGYSLAGAGRKNRPRPRTPTALPRLVRGRKLTPNVGDKGAVVMPKSLNLQKLGTFCLRPVHAFLDLVPVDLAEDRVSVPYLLVLYTHPDTQTDTYTRRHIQLCVCVCGVSVGARALEHVCVCVRVGILVCVYSSVSVNLHVVCV